MQLLKINVTKRDSKPDQLNMVLFIYYLFIYLLFIYLL